MFDYFHLSVISVAIHASLVALHQPLIRSGKGWFTLLNIQAQLLKLLLDFMMSFGFVVCSKLQHNAFLKLFLNMPQDCLFEAVKKIYDFGLELNIN